MTEKRGINRHAFFLFYLDSICDLMGCEMAKGMLQRVGQSVADKVIEKFGGESLHVDSLADLANTENPLTYFDDTLTLDENESQLFILEKCPFLELLDGYKDVAGNLPETFSNITESYNEEGLGYAVSPFCIIHQTYRDQIAEHIKIDGESVELLQLGCKAASGDIKYAPENLEKTSKEELEIEKKLEKRACAYSIQVKN
ncbi:MAG: hypothetical protein ACOC44_16370 [Promethearchaeia archaeon]